MPTITANAERTRITSPAVNPLLADPTRTATLRKRFMAEFNRRFLELKSKVIELVVKEDAFGLKPLQRPFTANRRFAFRTTPEQVQAFREWLGKQVDSGILTISEASQADDAYWRAYVEDGYRKGSGRAFDDTRRLHRATATTPEGVAGYLGSREEFLRSAFGRPVAIQKVKLLAGRVFTELRGVTESMAQRMTRELTDGLVRGANPRDVARSLNKAVDIGRKRSLVIARTECLTGDTLVDGAVVRAAFRRWYEGDVVEIVTRNGRKFTATPNHPMLTQDGWVGAGLIEVGDNLICNNRAQGFRSSGNQDVQRSPTTIRDIFDSLAAIGVPKRIAATEPDFHGDGRNGQVDVSGFDGELRVGRFSPITEPVADSIFTFSGKSASRFCNQGCGLLPVDKSICLVCRSDSHPGFLESFDYSQPVDIEFLGQLNDRNSRFIEFGKFANRNIMTELVGSSSLFPRQSLPFRNRSTDAFLPKDFADLFLVGANSNSDFSLSHSREIQFDDVISVRLRPFSGHVYNLETDCGYFTIDSLYTGNTIRAHSEGQLDSLESLGVDKLGVMVEWSTSKVGTCELCIPLDGMVLKLSEAKGMIPRHPNCRCSWIPASVGESPKGQTRSQDKIEKSIRESIKRERPKVSLADARRLSRWHGADAKIAKVRPVSALDRPAVADVPSRSIPRQKPRVTKPSADPHPIPAAASRDAAIDYWANFEGGKPYYQWGKEMQEWQSKAIARASITPEKMDKVVGAISDWQSKHGGLANIPFDEILQRTGLSVEDMQGVLLRLSRENRVILEPFTGSLGNAPLDINPRLFIPSSQELKYYARLADTNVRQAVAGVPSQVAPRQLPSTFGRASNLRVTGQHGKSASRSLSPMNADELSAELRAAFGREVSADDIANLAGAPDGANVNVTFSRTNASLGKGKTKEVKVTWDKPGFGRAERSFVVGRSGQIEMFNDEVFLEAAQRGQGHGMRILGRQIEHAQRLGIKRMRTYGAGDYYELQRAGIRGYDVWPRLGYDGDLEEGILKKLPDDLSGARRLSDLMKTQRGRDWWRIHGEYHSMEFDLAPNSLSMRVAREYLERRAGVRLP